MATPSAVVSPSHNARVLADEKVSEAFVQGHDADGIPEDSFAIDMEKDAESHAHSTLAENRSQSDRLSDHATEGLELPSAQTAQPEELTDPNIVDWDGPDDPENPQNWTAGRKWGIIAALGAVALITPLASSFFAPGVPKVLQQFHESSDAMAEFVVSIYILGFAIGPLIVAPLSEIYGRRRLYDIANFLFVVFNIACALSTSFGMLIAFRLLAGCAGSAPLTLGGGTIGDLFLPHQRAGAMAVWAMGPLLGPVLGPVAAGFLVEHASWRWVFWILAISGGIFGSILVVVGRETYHPTLLERKAARLRKETGNMDLRSKLASNTTTKELFVRAIMRPMKMLFLSPIVGLMSLYIAVNYGILYLFFTTVTFVFRDKYHFSSSSTGLSFLGVGIGMFIGMTVLGIASDRIVVKQQARGSLKPEHRLTLRLTLPGAIGLPCGVFVYGWTTYYGVHWIVPIIATSFIGLGNLTAMMTIQTYLVDAYTIHAASAIAANTVLRSVFGAVLPLSGLSLYNKLGLGWGNSLLGFIALAFIPVPILFRYYGERIRTNKRWQVQF